ncbi:MAG TPA: HAD hydrolase-like protein [Bryobacteraceae bacterium]|nr:HAD hydrolase-like protein [Bryobacteraceae bacterium]
MAALIEKTIVFDMDGVLTEVSESYREAIVQTVAHFTGQTITRDLIQKYKNQGGWNNDWALSHKIAADLGVNVEYGNIVNAFNERFLGQNGDGLIRRESWFPQPGLLERLLERFELAIFTGRLRYEADISLNRFAADLRFDPIICADNVVKGKPAPDGLHSIQRVKPGHKLIYVGDTVDDARSASAAGVPFIGIAAETHSRRGDLIELFKQENAVAIIENINEIEGAL